MSSRYSRVRFALGLLSLAVGLIAANLALFSWVERTSLQYLFGAYARYICAYGGFASIILGSMLVNESASKDFEPCLTPFNAGPSLMMGGNWSINGVETHAICVGAGSNKEQEAKEERYESRNKQNWIREEQSIRGRIRHIFRDAKTGRFIKRPKK